jgi:uncharacterized protein (TIGR02284 family)
MATQHASPQDTVKLLNDLIQLDFDSIAAYRATMARLEDPTSRAKLTEFLADHERHTRDLAHAVRELHGAARTEAETRPVLKKGKAVLSGLKGDHRVLEATKSNEEQTTEAYEKAIKQEHLQADVVETLRRNLEDERRHRAWIEERMHRV